MRSLGCLFVIALVFTACNEKPAAPPPVKSTDTSASYVNQPSPQGVPAPPIEKIAATPEAVKKAESDLQMLAERDRRMHAVLTFDEFKAQVYKEPFEGGKYIVNGDTPIANEKQLQEFYEEHVKPKQIARLIVSQVSGIDAKWNQQQQRSISYCVSNTFGARHDNVVQQMTQATGAWESVANVHYIHDATQDANCTPANNAVIFDVRPVNVTGEYLARAFFPNEPRAARNVLIDESSFNLDPLPAKLQLTGILRHELGHTLGFRHEQTRPQAGTCFEDKDWRPLTTYDAFSVMHYPQCNGKGDWSLILTDKDKSGVACLYGPAQGFTIDGTLVAIASCFAAPATPPHHAEAKTETFAAQSVAKDAQKSYGPFAVASGTQLDVVMGGGTAQGDPDLYVRFDLQAKTNAYDCRPYLDGPAETCSLTVPSNARQVFVMVRGFQPATYDLRITHTVPAADGTGAH